QVIVQGLMHPGAEEAQFTEAHQAVDVGPRALAAVGPLNAASQGPGKPRGTDEAEVSPPGELAQGQTGNEIQEPEKPMRLIPGIAGQPFVRAFTGLSDLVAAGMDLAGKQ